VSETNHCPQCGTELDEASPEGLCPGCLLKLGLSGAIPPLREEGTRAEPPKPEPPKPVPHQKRRLRLWWVVVPLVVVLGLVAAATLRTPSRPPDSPVVRFTISPQEGEVGDLALSPDGTRLAFTLSSREGQPMLWVHRMDSDQRSPLQGTEGASYPFWSPDSRYVGFFAQGKLKSVLVSGGGPLSLCDAPDARGGTWHEEGGIVFASARGLRRVSAAGGAPVAVSDPQGGSAYPSFLPDGRRFVFWRGAGNEENRGIYIGSLDAKEVMRLIASAQGAVYANGHLMYLREGTLLAQPFDPVKARLIGEPRPIADGIRSAFSVSNNGVLAYRTGDDPKTQLVWIDRLGKMLGALGEPGELGGFALSPDGKTVAVARPNSEAGGSSLWLMDLGRGTNMRLTFAPLHADAPVWSPDGSRIVFQSSQGNERNLYQVMSNGAGQAELLWKSVNPLNVDSWSRDGRFLVFTVSDHRKASVWMLPFSGERKPTQVLENSFNVRQGRISPDGRWIAYVSDETGRNEVYVQTFPPGSGGKWLVSGNGGTHPEWRGDGREITYISGDHKLTTVGVAVVGGELRPGAAQAMFEIPGAGAYGVTADGQRFLVKMRVREPESGAIHVVLNWVALNGGAELRK